MKEKINQTGERAKQFVVIAATLAVISVNYLAGTGQINDKSPAYVSDKYPTLLTPAGYAFGIWSLIYLGLMIFSVYQALPSQTENPRFRKIRLIYIVNCAANCAWIYLWNYEMIRASVAVIFVILATLVLINVRLQIKNSPAETWAARVPFGLYFGWITVAAILNFTVALASSGVQMSKAAATVSASILIIASVILGIVIRLKLSIAAYAVAVAWALTAIAVNHGSETLLVTLAGFGVNALLIAAIYPLSQVKKLK